MFENRRSLHTFSLLITLCVLFGLVLAACGGSGVGTAAQTSTAPARTSVTTNPFQVTGVSMTVSPASINGMACGTAVTITYTATFHVLADSPGGTVQFLYTTGSGQKSPTTSLQVGAGKTSQIYTFTWHGQLSANDTAPGTGGIVVNSPNALTSQLVKPAGTCKQVGPTPTPVPFTVTKVVLTTSVTPTGPITCGTEEVKENYNITFYIAPNGPGGTLVFLYTPDQSQTTPTALQNYNLEVNPGQTSVTYSFFWEDPISAGIELPGVAVVHVLAPQAINSNSVPPLVTGCHK